MSALHRVMESILGQTLHCIRIRTIVCAPRGIEAAAWQRRRGAAAASGLHVLDGGGAGDAPLAALLLGRRSAVHLHALGLILCAGEQAAADLVQILTRLRITRCRIEVDAVFGQITRIDADQGG